jgi:hypothetical protein
MILWCGAIVMNRHYTPVLPPSGSAGAVLRGGAQQDLSQTVPELIRQTRLHKAEKGRRRGRKGRNRFDVCVCCRRCLRRSAATSTGCAFTQQLFDLMVLCCCSVGVSDSDNCIDHRGSICSHVLPSQALDWDGLKDCLLCVRVLGQIIALTRPTTLVYMAIDG